MLAVKAVKQNIEIAEIRWVLETFRHMVNEAIRVGLEKGITSRFSLSNAVYKELHNGLHTWYILSAVEKACAILKNYRKAKKKNPKTQKPFPQPTRYVGQNYSNAQRGKFGVQHVGRLWIETLTLLRTS